MGWSSDEEKNTKKKMELSSKILLGIIACILLIIALISMLLINIEQGTYTISVDGKPITTTTKSKLLTTIDNITYINIEEFSSLVGYEYHKGEYKGHTSEDDKCYVQGKEETATFYLNDSKVCKLLVGNLTDDYQEYEIEDTIKNKEKKMYATIEAIKLAFNVEVRQKEKSFEIFTLDTLVKLYNDQIKKEGYVDITDYDFENKKALLHGYLIVKKEDGLYKVIDDNNDKELIPNKYTAIQFNEFTKEFFVTNSLEKVGIINSDGTTKIEPVYDSISVLNKALDLYIVNKDGKYGVVESGNKTVIYPEYDKIGLDTNSMNTESKYFIFNSLIPVCKDNKWGACDLNGKVVYKTQYDGFGCNIETIEVDGTKKEVGPLLEINLCDGVVVQKNKKYGLIDITGRSLVSISLDAIYQIEGAEDEISTYFMLYKGKELNVIERLIDAGVIEDPYNDLEDEEKNIIQENSITVPIDGNTNTAANTNDNSNLNSNTNKNNNEDQ